MEAKTFEIRDRGTFIPLLAVKLAPSCEPDRYLLARAGYGVDARRQAEYVVLWPLEGSGAASYDPFKLGGGPRTYPIAGTFIIEHFDELASGAVIDVEFLLQETTSPKRSEREEVPDGL
jgi:hypothetical protein